jgi:hypothetical protein
MNKIVHKKTKSIIVILAIIVVSFFMLLFALGLIPLTNLNNKQSFDIQKEITTLNSEGTRKFSIEESDCSESIFHFHSKMVTIGEFKKSVEIKNKSI